MCRLIEGDLKQGPRAELHPLLYMPTDQTSAMEVVLQKMKPQEARLPLLIIGLTEEVKDDPSEMMLSGPLAKLAESVMELGDFKGAKGESALVYSIGKGSAERVL